MGFIGLFSVFLGMLGKITYWDDPLAQAKRARKQTNKQVDRLRRLAFEAADNFRDFTVVRYSTPIVERPLGCGRKAMAWAEYGVFWVYVPDIDQFMVDATIIASDRDNVLFTSDHGVTVKRVSELSDREVMQIITDFLEHNFDPDPAASTAINTLPRLAAA